MMQHFGNGILCYKIDRTLARARSKDQISNLISGNIEPLLEFEVQNINIDNHPITIIEVPEGNNKPYSHRQLGVYVRSGSTDRHATRIDLDEIYEEREQFPL